MKRKPLFFAFAALLVASLAQVFLSCASASSRGAEAGGNISISAQGVFASGGSVTEPAGGEYNPATNWLDMERPGNTSHVDHANTFFQIPAGGSGIPVVFLHGYGQSRNGWLSSPDGREGWASDFLRRGYSVFLVDTPRTASAGASARMPDNELDAWGEDGKSYKPGDQAWYTHFRIGRVPPERYAGSQFPESEEALNQFFRQMTPATGDFDEELFGRSLSAALSDTRARTGKKAVYITHSRGSRVGWQTDAENIAAVVAVEPGGSPEIGSSLYRKFLDARIPILFLFGDYIDNGPEDIMSTEFWKNVRDGAEEFARAYRKDGGDAEVIDLPKIGITGNSHFMFQEKNSAQIAGLVMQWLAERGL